MLHILTFSCYIYSYPFILYIHPIKGKWVNKVFKLQLIKTKNDINWIPRTRGPSRCLFSVPVFFSVPLIVSISLSLSSLALWVSLSLSYSLPLRGDHSFCLWSITPSIINFLFNSNSGVGLNSFLCSVKNTFSQCRAPGGNLPSPASNEGSLWLQTL